VNVLSISPAISPAISLQSAIVAARAHGEDITSAAEELVVRLFQQEGRSLVRLARLFVDDRDAAEDLVQEAFLRLARSAHRISDVDRAPAYLRSIVLNLARDHNRRGLVSLRHHSSSIGSTSVRSASIGRPEAAEASPAPPTPDMLVQSEDHRMVIEAVRSLPVRQRDCITLRYFEELGIDAIATTLGLSPNSVKTHLQRGLAGLERSLSGSR
jgi:RNA polymerase sigma factor (sigma-70 family)